MDPARNLDLCLSLLLIVAQNNENKQINRFLEDAFKKLQISYFVKWMHKFVHEEIAEWWF